MFAFIFNYHEDPNAFVKYDDRFQTNEDLDELEAALGEGALQAARRSKKPVRFKVALPPGSAELKGRERWGARLRWRSATGTLHLAARVVQVSMETNRAVSCCRVFGQAPIAPRGGSTAIVDDEDVDDCADLFSDSSDSEG